MARSELVAEERGEPSLVYVRRAHAGAPVELVIVEPGKTSIWRIRSERVLSLGADLVNFAATERHYPK